MTLEASLVFKFCLFIGSLLAALGLCCFAQALSSCSQWGLLLTVAHGLPLVVTFLVEYLGSRVHGGEGDGTPLQHSCLENPMDGGAWGVAVHGVATERLHFHALEKEMATHSSVLAWRIPGTVEPGGLPSMGLHRVGHN